MSKSSIGNFLSDAVAMEGNFISTEKSKNRALSRYVNIHTSIVQGLIMTEKCIPLFNSILKVLSGPITKGTMDKVVAFRDSCIALDYARGTDKELKDASKAYLLVRLHNLMNKKDMMHEDIKKQLDIMVNMQSSNSEENARFTKCSVELTKIYKNIDELVKKSEKDEEKMNYLGVVYGEYEYFSTQLFMYINDMKAIKYN